MKYLNKRALIWCLYFVVFSFLMLNLDNPNLWVDESGQFWISKGLNHVSEPLQQNGDLTDVIIQNQKYNLDPGGFSIILHFWSKVSNNHQWLRTLPFLFFVLTVVLYVKIIYQWTKHETFSLIFGLVPAFSPTMIQYAFEVRAYSMECFGVAFCLWFIQKTERQITVVSSLVYGCILAILVTSRYSMIVPAAVVSLLYLINVFYRNEFGIASKIKFIFCYSLPLLISTALIYFVTLRYQNPSAKPPAYINGMTLKYGVSYLFEIKFFVPFILLLGFIIFYVYVRNKFEEIGKKFDNYFWFLSGVNVIFIVLSIFGYYSYNFTSRWTISLHTLFLFSLSASASMGLLIWQTRATQNLIRKLQIVTVSLIILTFVIRLTPLNKWFIYKPLTHLYEPMKENNLRKYKNILVSKSEYCSIRYLFEYGALKKTYEPSSIYPTKFFISSTPDIENLDSVDAKYDFVILFHRPLEGIDEKKWKKINPRAEMYERISK